MIRTTLIVSAAALLAASLSSRANASTFDFTFAGPGVSGMVHLTYGAAADAKYDQAFEITGVSGTFSDSNNGLNIVNASINGLVPINNAAPEITNHLAPADFSKFAVASGLPAQSHGALTFDNLYYPGGSPPTASDYQIHGGFLDIYGLLFDIGGGRVVDVWSNGDYTGTGTGPIDYGAAVATASQALDYQGGGVSITPEPSALCVLGGGLLGMLFWRRAARNSSL